MKILVIGYGNRSRNDDGVGWAVIDRLGRVRLPQVELAATHQLEVDLAETIREFDLVIFVDAGVPTAAELISRAVVRPHFQGHAVAHFLAPADLLALSQSLYGTAPRGVLFTIRGANFDFGDRLSPAVDRAANEVVRQITRLVRGVGGPPQADPPTGVGGYIPSITKTHA